MARKLTKDEFIKHLENDKANYSSDDIYMYADEFFENQASLKKNVANFKKWVK